MKKLGSLCCWGKEGDVNREDAEIAQQVFSREHSRKQVVNLMTVSGVQNKSDFIHSKREVLSRVELSVAMNRTFLHAMLCDWHWAMGIVIGQLKCDGAA